MVISVLFFLFVNCIVIFSLPYRTKLLRRIIIIGAPFFVILFSLLFRWFLIISGYVLADPEVLVDVFMIDVLLIYSYHIMKLFFNFFEKLTESIRISNDKLIGSLFFKKFLFIRISIILFATFVQCKIFFS